ncbi:NAD(P)/FAD-dependent oxidoreductase [Sandarakinorhabdus sp.]|uniref:flavin-containing monooxygenase n=1 Tax=Sandarakinorhabdus sp. TaxID=1916663 RepID=UPI00286E87F1|nr:NAD(P)/FAD-dependent oxidoreductase [Sandarakinorhabdus sp.]
MHDTDFDVLIVGAGLSGIGAAVHLKKNCPNERFAILEGREAIGGTWDLFRYPGIRSDSDMYTLGYNFKPWTSAKAIADGPSIRSYVRETADEHDLNRHIHYGHKVAAAKWDSTAARWTITTTTKNGSATFTCRFLFMCSGYYNYTEAYRPTWDGEADFKGTIIHPQFWPENLDHAGKRVVVIGSGATAVTIVPVMAETAAHVTMLQRSPTWMASGASSDWIANVLKAILPAQMAYKLVRWKNVSFGMWFYKQTRVNPGRVRETMLKRLAKQLPANYDIKTHFTPSYNPWDQRLCLVPDGDLFKSISDGKTDIVTDHIEKFEAGGIRLKSGKLLEADLIVTATGLKLQAMGGMTITVDGKAHIPGESLAYKGMMFSGVPNLAQSFGYINASWTLRSDLIAGYVCRLLNHMRATGVDSVTPTPAADVVPARLMMDLQSGYVQRGSDVMPKSGNRAPWVVTANYTYDRKELQDGPVTDEVVFAKAQAAPAALLAAAE